MPEESVPDAESTPSEPLGLLRRDRLKVFDETAEAATDTSTPFWLVLLLSGAIATLGLILDSTAVVIGAMLVAPMLGPILGLSLALAVGDGRLAIQTLATIALGAAGVVALAALMTWLLPFPAVTDEIAARTRPTTLDLAVAIASGLAGAVVTASRRSTLSGSIPGVAVAVALIPPLSAAGFGLGTLRPEVAAGSLLLFGANLAGIVLAGLGVFLLVGMHRPDVVLRARAWHERGEASGLAGWLADVPLVAGLRVFASPGSRVALVLAFVALVAWPLSASLTEVLRESRVQGAAASAVEAARDAGAVVLDRSVTYGADRSAVRLRVASREPLPTGLGASLSREASRRAREPVTVTVERVLAGGSVVSSPAPAPAVPSADERVAAALGSLDLPDGASVVAMAVGIGGPPPLQVAYTAPSRLPANVEIQLARDAADAAGVRPDGARAVRVPVGRHALPADSAAAAARVATLAAPVRTFEALWLDVVVPDSLRAAWAKRWLAGTPRARVAVDSARAGATLRVR